MTQTESQTVPRAPKSKRRRHRRAAARPAGRRMAQVASALAVVAVAASGYLIYTGEIRPRLAGESDAGTGTGARLDAVEKRLRAQADAAAQIDARVDARLDQIETQLGQLDAAAAAAAAGAAQSQASAQHLARAMQELSDAVDALRADAAGRDRGAWHAAEAAHLLVIANQRLQLGGDAALARRALEFADDRLRRAADPALTPVRARIAEEIAALDQTPPVDTAGVLHKLAALARAVAELPLAGDALAGAAPAAPVATAGESNTAGESKTVATAADSTGWLAAGKNLLADLGGLVQVETIDADAPPVLPAETRALVRANAALMLQAAQVAFLQGDGAVYAERMAAAADWVGAYFPASAATRDWLARLHELAAVSPAPALPDISGSLRALRAAAGN